MFSKLIPVVCLLFTVSCMSPQSKAPINSAPPVVKKYQKGYRTDIDGWIYVHIEGEPFERGKQYGFLVAKEYVAALKCYDFMTYQYTGMKDKFFAKEAAKLQRDLISEEWLDR